MMECKIQPINTKEKKGWEKQLEGSLLMERYNRMLWIEGLRRA